MNYLYSEELLPDVLLETFIFWRLSVNDLETLLEIQKFALENINLKMHHLECLVL